MGSWRFRRSVKVAPGIKLNFNKKSMSVSAGVRGAHVTVNNKGQRTVSVGLPGTGLSYRDTRKASQSDSGAPSLTADANFLGSADNGAGWDRAEQVAVDADREIAELRREAYGPHFSPKTAFGISKFKLLIWIWAVLASGATILLVTAVASGWPGRHPFLFGGPVALEIFCLVRLAACAVLWRMGDR